MNLHPLKKRIPTGAIGSFGAHLVVLLTAPMMQ